MDHAMHEVLELLSLGRSRTNINPEVSVHVHVRGPTHFNFSTIILFVVCSVVLFQCDGDTCTILSS